MSPNLFTCTRPANAAWACCALWAGGSVAGTLLAALAASRLQVPEWLGLVVVALFWVNAVGFLGYALRHPRIKAAVLPGGIVRVVMRYPHRLLAQDFAAHEMLSPVIASSQGGGDDAHYQLRLPARMASGECIVIEEGSHRLCATTLRRFRQAVHASMASAVDRVGRG